MRMSICDVVEGEGKVKEGRGRGGRGGRGTTTLRFFYLRAGGVQFFDRGRERGEGEGGRVEEAE
jgi:hypothetical protein